MKCMLIFDQMNTLLYMNSNRKFSKHVKKLAKREGLIGEISDSVEVNADVVIQLFSPIITSQKVMNYQFGNSYSSIQCEDGVNIAFDEYMGYLFVHIGMQNISSLKRVLAVCVTCAKYLCGPDIAILKTSRPRTSMLTRFLDTWLYLQDHEQSMLVEAVEPLIVNADLSTATVRALEDAVEKVRAQTDYSRAHALVLVENKFLSLYSSRSARELPAGALLFLGLLSETLHSPREAPPDTDSEAESEDQFYSPRASPEPPQPPELYSQLLMLPGPALCPTVVHCASLGDGLRLLLVLETNLLTLSTGLCEAFAAMSIIQTIQIHRDMDGTKHAFEDLDGGVKKVLEGLKRLRGTGSEMEGAQRKLQVRWETAKKRYAEYTRTQGVGSTLQLEGSTSGLLDSLREILHLAVLDPSIVMQGIDTVQAVVEVTRRRLRDYSEFLRVKALRNFTIGSYLEEFPGLVHFLYIDRNSHRVTAPSLDFSSEETTSLTKKKIWTMVEFSREHVQEGHLAVMWKDTTFNYAYFLWFEDSSGSPLKPKVSPAIVVKSLPRPGVMCEDFYQQLLEACFPKTSPSKVRCYELYCVHLGLATSSCVLEQSRRLAATIWEVTGIPNNPLDLL